MNCMEKHGDLPMKRKAFPWPAFGGLAIVALKKAGWFIKENATKMDDLGVPPCIETSI